MSHGAFGSRAWRGMGLSSSGRTDSAGIGIYAERMNDYPGCDSAGAPAALPTPVLKFFADLAVQVGSPQEVGQTAQGLRRVVPIVGGTARGDGWAARVLPGGADFQRIVNGSLSQLDARYVLETDAGDRIYVQNQAIRCGPAELIARLGRGEPVDPAQIYFRCHPRFETACAALAWISERCFVGTGARYPDRVAMRFFELT